MTRVAVLVDVMNIMELVEMASNVSTMGLVDFLVGVGVGIAWWIT